MRTSTPFRYLASLLPVHLISIVVVFVDLIFNHGRILRSLRRAPA